MKPTRTTLLTLALFLGASLWHSLASAATITSYRFVGSPDSGIDFTLGVEFDLPGMIAGIDGTLTPLDPLRDTFLTSYRSGNFSYQPVDGLFQRLYGENILTPEGPAGCLYVLNSLEVCDPTSEIIAGNGAFVGDWQPGRVLSLVLFDFMGPLETTVVLDSVSSVPLPPAAWLLASGLLALLASGQRQRTGNGLPQHNTPA